MGVTIHYRGRLNDVGQLGRLCEELTDIAAAMRWKSMTLDDDWETGDMRTLKAKMDFLNEKIAYLSDKLSSARLGDVSDLSPDELASKIEELLLEDEQELPGIDDSA